MCDASGDTDSLDWIYAPSQTRWRVFVETKMGGFHFFDPRSAY